MSDADRLALIAVILVGLYVLYKAPRIIGGFVLGVADVLYRALQWAIVGIGIVVFGSMIWLIEWLDEWWNRKPPVT